MRSTAPDADSITDLFEGLEAYVAEHRARASAPPLTIFHDTEHPEATWDVEVAVPIDRPVPKTDRIRSYKLPAVTDMACVVHSGDYARIHLASNALLSFAAANDYRASGPSREVYLRFGAGQIGYELPKAYLARHSNEFVTELQLPVEPVQERSKRWPTTL